MGVSSQMDLPKLKFFNLLSQAHEIFRRSKYKGNIKLDKIWGYQNGGYPLTQGFLTGGKFSPWVNFVYPGGKFTEL